LRGTLLSTEEVKKREEDKLRAVDVRKGRGAKKTNCKVSRETRTVSLYLLCLFEEEAFGCRCSVHTYWPLGCWN
jgi:hypothetical protein